MVRIKRQHRDPQAHQKKIDKKTQYNFEDAIKLVKDCASAKFNESIEAHISLNIDPKYADQQLRTTVVLPYGTGKKLRIAALVAPDKIIEAKAEYITDRSIKLQKRKNS
jgi:large subunit ribosomal protein L1